MTSSEIKKIHPTLHKFLAPVNIVTSCKVIATKCQKKKKKDETINQIVSKRSKLLIRIKTLGLTWWELCKTVKYGLIKKYQH